MLNHPQGVCADVWCIEDYNINYSDDGLLKLAVELSGLFNGKL